MTIFDVFRNQYVFLSEGLLIELPDAAFFVVASFVIVEMAEEGNEGLVYSLLTTISNLGKSVPNAVSNQMFAGFSPALSDSANYIAAKGGDQPCFRRTVAWSVLLGYAFAFTSLATLPLMPSQKADALHRKRSWPHHTGYAVATVLLVGVAMAYSLTLNLLAMFESTACLSFVGGQGCGLNSTAGDNATAC